MPLSITIDRTSASSSSDDTEVLDNTERNEADRGPSQHVEPSEGIKIHPTISQDWTNRNTVDRNRLVMLQGKTHLVSQTGNQGIPEESEEPEEPDERVWVQAGSTSPWSYRKYSEEVPTRIEKRKRKGARAAFLVQDPHYLAFANHRAVPARLPQEQEQASNPVYSSSEEEEEEEEEEKEDCSSLTEEADRPRSPIHGEYRSHPPKAPLHSPSMTDRKPGRPERLHSNSGQSHGEDRKMSMSPQLKKNHKDDDNGSTGLEEDRNPDGSSQIERQTRSRAKVQFGEQNSNDYSCQPPELIRPSQQMNRDTQGSDANILVHQLRSELKALKREKLRLETKLQKPLARLQVVYRIHRDHDEEVTDMYLDQPQFLRGDKDMASLQGHLPITNMESYLERHPEVAFIVFQDSTDEYSRTEAEDGSLKVSWSESIFVTSRKLKRTVEKISKRLSFSLGRRISLGLPGSTATLPAPYLPFYHYSENLRECATDLPQKATHEWRLLVDYIDQKYGDEYKKVDRMLKAGNIPPAFIPYLIKDGDLIVRADSHDPSAYLATSQPTLRVSESNLSDKDSNVSLTNRGIEDSLCPETLDDTFEETFDSAIETQLWDIGTEFWDFDGNFQKCYGTVTLKISSRSDELLSIRDLSIHPIQFAESDLASNMRNTGLEFWKSRSRRYVSYCSERVENETKSTEPRYMIDPATYRKLHSKDTSERRLRDDLGPEVMSAKEPPPDPFLMLLPRTINGFNMQNKKWEELQVARISEVSWNKEAFESLVVEPTTKTLIKALVMQQLEREKGTDLIAGKGQGLIVLLHGGPGTGKTFTAETVAEIAEKPLYRVTCGDLGTEPTDIEKYLESVLYLGKIWDCVVLLDEADVYLEERSMESLARNALVSVFLRVLEYYEGILILTSNRVGTFDESFKSRIQLALHYEKLKLNDRRTIWENFIRRLHKVEEVGIDFDDINHHIHDLAMNELNGRQIRNAVTTARQFARYQKKDLDYADLQQVIKIALKFDRHTTEMQGGMTDDARKREEGIRP